jgi:hypothetical protein
MKKLTLFLCSLALVLGMAVSVSALNFTLDSYVVKLNVSDPGLVLYWEPILQQPQKFNLEVGQSTGYVPLFKLGTYETWANADDKAEKDISVTFNFSSPAVSSNATGTTVGKTWWWIASWGEVTWNNPAQFRFGDTGLFNISLTNAWFGTPGSATIYANLDYVSAASVPEPYMVLLMGAGFLGLVAYGRKRVAKK